MSARKTALDALIACRKQAAWSNGVLKDYIARDRLDRRDAALATRLCYGVLQHRGMLDFFLQQLLTGKVKDLHPVVRDILHMGLYQIYELDKIPDSAAVNEDGYYWYVGRADDVIKSSGYRIGPFEIESVIMELPYVLECGVTGVPDEVRGQVVKACIVLTKGTEGTDELKKEIQNYVKQHTAPYKYPRIVEFREQLPKTISGKIQRNKL